MSSGADLHLLGVLGALFLLVTLSILPVRRMRNLIRLYALHSLLLALCAAFAGYVTDTAHLYLVAGLTALVKVLAIPYSLEKIIHNSLLEKREIQYLFGVPGCLFTGGLLSLIAFYAATRLAYPGNTVAGLLLPVGTAVALLGIFTVVSRLEAVPQISGLLITENGITLIAVATAFNLPLVVEFGLLLDILAGALILAFLVMRLQQDTGTSAVGTLRKLKG